MDTALNFNLPTLRSVNSHIKSSHLSRTSSYIKCAAVAPGKKQHTVTLLPGDGIGPEVISVAKNVLNLVASREGEKIMMFIDRIWLFLVAGLVLINVFDVAGIHFDFHEMPVGGCALDLTGVPLQEETLNAAMNSDGFLLGAIGG